jgi:hypothetical protein
MALQPLISARAETAYNQPATILAFMIERIVSLGYIELWSCTRVRTFLHIESNIYSPLRSRLHWNFDFVFELKDW